MASSSAAPANDFANMPPRTADLEETWTFLNGGVDHIMTNFETGLSFKGYTSLYSTVYNYCTSTKMHGKLEGNRSEFCASCDVSIVESYSIAGANLVGSDLYNKLSGYFVEHFKGMLEVRSS